jgi:hypothetical protein
MSEGRSTINSTIKGKAYEYASVLALVNLVSLTRPVLQVENSSLEIARRRYLQDITESDRKEMLASATAGIGAILKMEPRIMEDGLDPIEVSIQPDNVAKLGDVRDVLVIRRDITWEIGVSVKHNHEALKHSRLSEKLNFGELWLELSTSDKYFDSVRPIFNSLRDMQSKNITWRSLERKKEEVYRPVLQAFIDELNRLCAAHGTTVTAGLIKYLLGSNGSDYYKLIHHNNHITRVIPFNLFGTLNTPGSNDSPETKIPIIDLPTRIIDLSFKEGSLTTVILTMDGGWAISFRIHSASTIVEPSLKFDIKLIGQPANLFFLDVAW